MMKMVMNLKMMKTDTLKKEETQIQSEKIELYYCFGVKYIKNFIILPTKNLPAYMQCLDCTLLFAVGATKTNLPINIKDSLLPAVGDVCSTFYHQNILIKEIEWI